VFEKNRRTVMTARFLAVRGRLQRAGLVIHVVAESFIDLSANLASLRDGELALPAVLSPSHQEGSWRMLKSRDFH
jgi:error-prone DNA polymerase